LSRQTFNDLCVSEHVMWDLFERTGNPGNEGGLWQNKP